MTAPYMRGLLDDGQTPFNPGLPPGLLDMMGQPGKPGANMVQNMQMLGGMSGGRAAGGMRSAPEQVTSPAMPAPPAPGAPPAAPEAPSMATNNALMYGGMAGMKAAQGGNQGSLGASLGEALAAGTQAFTATKDAEKDKADALKMQEQFTRTVRGLGLEPAAAAGIIALGPVAGAKLLAEHGINVAKAKAEPYTLSRGQQRYADGKLVAENVEPDKPFDITSMSAQMRDAFQVALRRDPLDPTTFGKRLTEDEAKIVNDWIAAQDTRKAPRTSVSVNAAEQGAERTMWTQAAGQLTTEYNDEIKPIPARIEVFDSVLSSLDSGNLITGSLADMRREAAQFGRLIGFPIDVNKITNSQTLVSELNNAALARLPELDSRPTDKDMEILLKASGDVGLTVDALRTIFTRARSRAASTVDRYKSRVEAFERDFEGTGYRVPSYLKEIEIPASREQSTLQESFLGVPGFRPRGQ